MERNDIHKSRAKWRWGHWSSVNFSSNFWDSLDTSFREAESLTAFKCGLYKAILWFLKIMLFYINLFIFKFCLSKFFISFFIIFIFYILVDI